MKRKYLIAGISFLILFTLWTTSLSIVDVRQAGPNGSVVGFSTLNIWFHDMTGANMLLYHITDWMGLVPVFTGLCFAALGIVQWIKRRDIRKVDGSILLLGGFYLVVLAAYLFFEKCPINYRPILIDGYLEVSYPSSTTLLVLCVMPTADLQLRKRMHNAVVLRIVIWIFIAFMVLGRMISGVHWITDIIGGALLSIGLVAIYRSVSDPFL